MPDSTPRRRQKRSSGDPLAPRGGPLFVLRFIDRTKRQRPFVEHYYFRRAHDALAAAGKLRAAGIEHALYAITVAADDWIEIEVEE